jgi:hypothetical protein
LDFIGSMFLGFSPLVFDGKHRAVGVKLHDIALPGDPESLASDTKSPGDADTGAGFIGTFVSVAVYFTPQSRESVFRP